MPLLLHRSHCLSTLLAHLTDVGTNILSAVFGIGLRERHTSNEEDDEEMGLVYNTWNSVSQFFYTDENAD